MRTRRLWTVACALTLALGVGACGHKESHPSVADSNNNGGYVDAGPVSYQLEISRVLNPYATEDSQYIKGLPAGTSGPTADEQWYGVFLWAKNQTQKPQSTADNFFIIDTQGHRYYPVKLNPDVNPYAWSSQRLAPLEIQPGPDTTASQGPTQGQVLLFKIGNSAYANRPLTLVILGSSGQREASISLDL
ncbi:MAG: hypothetical protein M3016_11115 [Actinomycetota bacterium]|nr:hypothetical protein [Actinomycetota bacterium]